MISAFFFIGIFSIFWKNMLLKPVNKPNLYKNMPVMPLSKFLRESFLNMITPPW